MCGSHMTVASWGPRPAVERGHGHSSGGGPPVAGIWAYACLLWGSENLSDKAVAELSRPLGGGGWFDALGCERNFLSLLCAKSGSVLAPPKSIRRCPPPKFTAAPAATLCAMMFPQPRVLAPRSPGSHPGVSFLRRWEPSDPRTGCRIRGAPLLKLIANVKAVTAELFEGVQGPCDCLFEAGPSCHLQASHPE